MFGRIIDAEISATIFYRISRRRRDHVIPTSPDRRVLRMPNSVPPSSNKLKSKAIGDIVYKLGGKRGEVTTLGTKEGNA